MFKVAYIMLAQGIPRKGVPPEMADKAISPEHLLGLKPGTKLPLPEYVWPSICSG